MCRRGSSTQEVRVRSTYSSSRDHSCSSRHSCSEDQDDYCTYHRRTPTYGTYIYTRSRSPSPPPQEPSCRCCCHAEEPTPRSLCHRRGSGGSSDRVLLEVRRRHEPSFNIRVSTRSKPEDVIAQLAPDQHGDEIVVHWRSGGHETLRATMAMHSVVSNARYLEVKTKTRTRFHW